MATGRQPVQGKKTQSSHFDFEAFKKVANGTSTLQSIGASNRGKYTNLIYELERSIKERDVELFEKTLRQLDKLSVKKIKSQLNDLQAKWGSGKSRGVDPFQNIKLKDDSLTVSVSPAPTTSEKKDAPPSKTRENVDAQRLREIAKILDGDDNQEKGAKQKKSPDIDVILAQIEKACQEVVDRSLKLIKNWTTEFENCVKERMFREDLIDPNTTNTKYKDENVILAQLNRSMKLLHEQKQDQDSLEENIKTKANKLKSTLMAKQPAVKDKKKHNGSKDQNLESMDTLEIMDTCISELNQRIVDLSDQANRLTQASEMLTETNKKLVAQIEPNKQKPTKPTTNNEQNELIQDLETVTQNMKAKLNDIETNCERYEKVVKKVDDEIEELEKDLDEWDEHKNNVDLKQEDEKCSFDALRKLRIKLQECKTESKETKNKDKGTKMGEKVKQLCGNYGIKTENKDDYVQMLEDLDKQLNKEKKSLKALEKEICDLLKHFDGQNEIPDKGSDMSTVDKLSSLIESANANVVKFKKDCRKDTETLQQEVDDWKERAKREQREKEEYMTRLQLEVGSDEWKESTKIEKQTKDDYMAMLSKIASAQLTDNNPNIPDLSDQNRPTKLAEDYYEIYDNEWTDAYTYLEEKIKTEPERIDKLLQVLLNVYNVCCKIRDKQIQGMTTAILTPAKFYHSQNVQQVAETRRSEMKSNTDTKLDSVLSQTLTNIDKQLLETTVDDVIQYFKTEHKELFEAEPMDRYSTKLIRLCWLMRLHLPPLCIDSIEEKGSKFDMTKYRAYTKSGKKIEFVVWPTLLLHENGGILKQGTAQGF